MNQIDIVASYNTCQSLAQKLPESNQSMFVYKDNVIYPRLLIDMHHEQSKFLAGFTYVPDPYTIPAYTLAELFYVVRNIPGMFSVSHMGPESIANYKHKKEDAEININQYDPNVSEAFAKLVLDLLVNNIIKL